jgi:hypothetical protein
MFKVDIIGSAATKRVAMTIDEIKAALLTKEKETKTLTVMSKFCVPFFLPGMNSVDGLKSLVDFIWVGHHGDFKGKESDFLAEYGNLLSDFGVL